ncbi:ABC transporter permease [Thalassotalea eurytherma]|uniref:Vi polysaccharide export inner-membrane protein VexB n=1 Tax=Thalassotalea eurytherma TaxID=1144278 RepID=A0ABQ6H1E4_9GAMM|nr:ABC transporter permease [Thalassotalea eurytherma]GLX81309.1 Vi polysaccharide export inner-membrane protein VexB [Thalassotalea eurytherma]
MAVAQKRSTLVLWKDVIFALWIRQLRSKFTDKFGVSWLVVQPVIFILALSFIRGRISGDDVSGIPMFVFMLLGFLPVIQFMQAWGTVARSIKQDKPLYAFRQVMPMASFVTASIIECLSNIIVLIILCIIAIMFLGIEIFPEDPIGIMLYLLEIQLVAYFLGIVTGLGALFIEEISKVEQLLQRPMLFISGAFFTLSDFPEEVWPYLSWNPVLQAVELSRHAYSNDFYLVSAISPTYLHTCVLFLMFIAFSLYIVLWKKGISR